MQITNNTLLIQKSNLYSKKNLKTRIKPVDESSFKSEFQIDQDPVKNMPNRSRNIIF